MSFSPFSRTEKPLLFSVPRAQYYGALRSPALFQQLAERASFFHHSHHAARGVFSAVHPCVVMIARDDPFIRVLAAFNPRDHVVDSLERPVESEFQMNSRRTWSSVISDGKRAAPRVGNDRSAQFSKHRQRVAIRDRQHRNFQYYLSRWT